MGMFQAAVGVGLGLCLGGSFTAQAQQDWPAYGGHDGTHYSSLSQINRDNVSTLKVAWTFHVGDISDGTGGKKRSGLETTPILVDGTLYLTSAFNRVFALSLRARDQWSIQGITSTYAKPNSQHNGTIDVLADFKIDTNNLH